MKHRVLPRRINANTVIEIVRALPVAGEIQASVGQTVTAQDMVGQSSRPGEFVLVNVAAALAKPVEDVAELMLKQVNEAVEEGEIIAQIDHNLPFLRRVCKAPATGVITAIAGSRVIIQTETEIRRLPALVNGTVSAVSHTQSVTIQTEGTLIEAACSLGHSGAGVLRVQSDDARADIDAEAFAVLDRQAVFVAGGTVDEIGIRRAEEMGVTGLIVGSIDSQLLAMDPPPRIPVIATEGFGRIPMASATMALLQSRLGDEASLFVGRVYPDVAIESKPQIVIAGGGAELVPSMETPDELAAGDTVRALNGSMAFAWGEVVALSDRPLVSETGEAFFGVEVIFPQGKIPISQHNLEKIS